MKKTPTKKKPAKMTAKKYACEACRDTGQFCINCLHADGDCVCEDGPLLESCDQCPEEANAGGSK